MPDLTEMVLLGGFGAAFGIFVLAALLRRRGVQRPAPGRNDDAGAEDAALDSLEWGRVLPPPLPVGRVPVWFYQPLDLLGAGLVFGVFGMLAWGAAGTARDAPLDLKPATLLVNIGFQCFMAGLVAMFGVRRVGWATWLGLRWPGWHWVFLIAPCAVLFMWAVFGGLQYSGYMDWMQSLGVETVQDTVKLLQKSEDPMVLGLMSLTAVIVAPICEEMVFRGYFYPVLKKFAGAWTAAACSAWIFASAHGNLTVVLPLFLFGGLLVFIYEKTGSIWAPIAVHCCFNSATVIVQIAARCYDLPLNNPP